MLLTRGPLIRTCANCSTGTRSSAGASSTPSSACCTGGCRPTSTSSTRPTGSTPCSAVRCTGCSYTGEMPRDTLVRVRHRRGRTATPAPGRQNDSLSGATAQTSAAASSPNNSTSPMGAPHVGDLDRADNMEPHVVTGTARVCRTNESSARITRAPSSTRDRRVSRLDCVSCAAARRGAVHDQRVTDRLVQVRQSAGLCGSCRHAVLRPTRRGTVYLRCALAGPDARYPKYPLLPVIRCDGYLPEPTSMA